MYLVAGMDFSEPGLSCYLVRIWVAVLRHPSWTSSFMASTELLALTDSTVPCCDIPPALQQAQPVLAQVLTIRW